MISKAVGVTGLFVGGNAGRAMHLGGALGGIVNDSHGSRDRQNPHGLLGLGSFSYEATVSEDGKVASVRGGFGKHSPERRNFNHMSPEWRNEHESAFGNAQDEARGHFYRCSHCRGHVCSNCWNRDADLCTSCSPKEEVYVAAKYAEAMKRNIDEEAKTATVWSGKLEGKKRIVCPTCGKNTGAGQNCGNCGASMDISRCQKCGARNDSWSRFCGNCGEDTAAPSSSRCSACMHDNSTGTKFCGGCGKKL
jgi:hypothetical protein